MDVVLINASLYELPPSHRAAAIVYDGTSDLGLWRPPGPDRELLQAYGGTLAPALDKERGQLPNGRLALDQALRLHPGKLRCDYLIWLAGRPPHGKTEPAPAPDLDAVERLAQAALMLASKHGTLRVAFGALGAGANAADVASRMAAVVRGADAFRAARLQQGAALPIEEVLVCASSAAEVAKARRLTAKLSRQAPLPPPPAAPRETKRAARSTSPRASGAPKRARGRNRPDPSELAAARVRAAPYDRGRMYLTGEWFIHPSFGAGQVLTVLGPERMLTALFEDGEERRLIHART
jgi:O-acetyl-ADP-ribose deacetylase (regulator of RNase III)